MSRALRLDFAGATWHVFSRGNNHESIFLDDVDRLRFLELLGDAVERFKWIVYEYELMTNHYHFALDTPEPTLSRGMQWLNGKYAQWFNRRHRRSGHLFQGRFGGEVVEKETELLNVCRYIALNAVDAGMVERPEDYRWGSYRAHAGYEEAPKWLGTKELLARFAPVRTAAQTLYRTFIAEGIGKDHDIRPRIVGQIFLGSEHWIEQMRARVESKPRSDDHPRVQRYVGRPLMPTIVKVVAETFGTTVAQVQKRGASPARRAAAWLGCYEGILSRRAIAAGLRLESSGRASDLISICDRELDHDEWLLKKIDRCCERLRALPPPPLTALTVSPAVLR